MVNTKSFYDSLAKHGLDFFAGVPDSLLADFCACIKQNSPARNYVIAANEGNAVAMCAGYYLSTAKPGVAYMQNSGEGNAVNPLLSLADPDVYSIPMLLVIGWRGEPGKHDEPQHVKQGKVTCSLLDGMGIPYCVLGDDYESQLEVACKYMKENSAPYAIIVRKGTFSEFKLAKEKSPYPLTREEALSVILENLGDSDAIVSTTGKTSREIFELREKRGEGHGRDFLTVGSMGHTASIAYGVSLGTDKTVWCIDGDGSFIMHMGGMGVIGADIPANFKYILNDNCAHESVGGQPTCSPSLDIPALLRGCGFDKVITASTAEEITEGMRTLRGSDKASLVLRTKQGSRPDLGRPTTTPIQNKLDFMDYVNPKQ